MTLVFIYGPPAVGKLTVADALGEATGFAVWDNHMSVDPLLPLFPFGSTSLSKLASDFRVAVLEECARENVDVVFTFVYAHPGDGPFVERVASAVEGEGGTVCFVQLTCDAGTQEARVLEEGRGRRRKLRSVELLRELHAQHDLGSAIPRRSSLTIDTTATPPEEAARMIAAHYALSRRDTQTAAPDAS